MGFDGIGEASRGPWWTQRRVAGLVGRVMVDCSHANSSKDHERQPEVVADVADQVRGGQAAIFGIMLESFLVDGNQNHESGAPLVYGQSIADAVRKRRGV